MPVGRPRKILDKSLKNNQTAEELTDKLLVKLPLDDKD